MDFSLFRQPPVNEKIGSLTVATATDGNHGRGLAWAARQFGCRTRVFMPKGTVAARVAVTGDLDTMMAGLACGEPNPYAWQILRDFSWGFISCSDGVAARGMTCLARPLPGDHRITGTFQETST